MRHNPWQVSSRTVWDCHEYFEKYHSPLLAVSPSHTGPFLTDAQSNAVLNSYLYEWSVLAPNTANQAFNTLGDCAFTWGKMWPRLAKYFEMEYTGPSSTSEVEFNEKGLKYEPPPHGKGPRSVMRYTFSFVDWAKDPHNNTAWKELASKHKLRESELKDVGSVFGRADFCLHRPFASIMR